MAQNSSGFFCSENFKRQSWKTILENWHKPSYKSEITGFYMEKIAFLLGVFSSFWFPYFCNRPFCSRKCCKNNICISCCRSRWFTSTNPMKLSAFASLPRPLVLGNSLLLNWFSSISPFAMSTKSMNVFTISFGTFSLFMILFTRGIHWPPAVFTVITNWLLGRFVLRVYLQFH